MKEIDTLRSKMLFQAIIYGVVQGITEFLPISSSAHLVLLPWFFGWKDPGLAFDVALHWGTLLGVTLYYRKECIDLTAGFFKGSPFSWKIVLATIPGVIIGFLCEKQAENTLRSPWILVSTLALFALILWWADHRQNHDKGLNDITWQQALLIGTAQGIAIIPGVSRSGVTMSAALLLGLARPAAVQFSFLMSIPITFGAGILKIKYLIQNISDPFVLTALAASAISGFCAIGFLVKFVRTKTFTPFVIYRLVLAGIIFLWIMK